MGSGVSYDKIATLKSEYNSLNTQFAQMKLSIQKMNSKNATADYDMAELELIRAQSDISDADSAITSKKSADEVNQRIELAQKQLVVADKHLKNQQADQLTKKGLALAKQKQWIDATFHYKQALKINPAHSNAKKALAHAHKNIYASKRRRKGSLETAFNVGVQHYIDGKYTKALTKWETVMKTNPDYSNVREYIAKAKAQLLEQELKTIKIQRPSKNEEVETLAQQAYTLFSLGQTDNAIKSWEKILVLDPSNKDAKRSLQQARARKDLALESNTDGRTRMAQELNADALRQYLDGDLQKAISTWSRALVLDPHNIKIKNNLTRARSELAAKRLSQ